MKNRYYNKLVSLIIDWRGKCHFFNPFEALLFTVSRYIKIGNHRKHEAIIEKLTPDFLKIMHQYVHGGSLKQQCMIEPDSPVWILWFQGEKQMPDIVKSCVQTVVKNAGTHKVNILDGNNLSDYIDLPDIILKKLSEEKISKTHFSDIVRMALLAKYGGYWIDATIFMTDKLVNYELPFYSIRKYTDNGFKDCRDWSSYFLACGKNNTYAKIISDYYTWYWCHHDYLIDYFLLDYTIAMLFRNCPPFHADILRMPIDNEHVHDMQRNLNAPYSDGLWKALCQTRYNKVSYKIKLKYGNTIGRRIMRNQ